jgi:hypothetical protein
MYVFAIFSMGSDPDKVGFNPGRLQSEKSTIDPDTIIPSGKHCSRETCNLTGYRPRGKGVRNQEIEKSIATRPEGATTNQPRATPWGSDADLIGQP